MLDRIHPPRFLTQPAEILEAAAVSAAREPSPSLGPRRFKAWLISEHSPIRRVILSFRFQKIPTWVSTHFARHVHSLHFVQSNRTDRTGQDERGDQADHLVDANCQALIEMARKRLCHKASPETRAELEEVKLALLASPDHHQRTLGEALVPNCVYRCGCPEEDLGRSCTFFSRFTKQTPAASLLRIAGRYDQYNALFKGALK